ncbi:MAG: glycoside hydrolase family 38 C-terminal domain-containing protein, partial [Omnitrophica WOR_2 bacterium]
IRSRIKEGRWEVTASTWVEADKNLPNGESQARHLLYTRRYLSQLLDLKPDAFQLDFEPDTFGHHANVPEILASGGVKYYYHCRGDKTHYLYRWAAPSGRSILVYLEPLWYLGYIEPSLALYAPSFCQQHGMDTLLKVYGVGDHGGGPTRRDVERIRDMATWPVFPVIRFGGFNDYFSQVEKVADQLPVVTGELNFVFTGCYTSQSRIKKANRLAEAALDSAETFCAAAAIKGTPYPVERFAKAWQNTLFNQFHDIIPGSGVIDTREYAMGLFQETMAHASSLKSRAFSALTKQNGRPAVVEDDLVASIAEGAGVGFGIEDFKTSQVSRGGRKERLFHICNPSPWSRKQVVEVIVWDWEGDLQRLAFKNASGQAVRHQVLDRGWNNYWGHKYLRALVEVEAPSCGYTTVVLTETDAMLDLLMFPQDPRTEEPEKLRLENERVSAIFDRQSCALVSLVDKASGAELVDPENPGVFRRIQEDDRVGGTAWTVGRYMTVQNLGEGARLLKLDLTGSLRQSFTYEIMTGPSKLTVTVSLDAGSDHLDYAVECDWHEIGRKGQGVPQLNFHLPVAYACRAYRYDIPFATVDRPSGAIDTPANSWGAALPQKQDQPVIQLITEGNYGFRGVDDSLALTLIRSSYDPDPYPEIGIHKIHFAIRVVKPAPENRDLIASAYDYTHRLDVYSGGNTQPDSFSFLSLEGGSVMVSALKTPEEGARDELIVRLYETDGREAPVELCFDQPIARAAWVDTHEKPVAASQPLAADGQRLSFTLEANRLVAIRIKFYS